MIEVFLAVLSQVDESTSIEHVIAYGSKTLVGVKHKETIVLQ